MIKKKQLCQFANRKYFERALCCNKRVGFQICSEIQSVKKIIAGSEIRIAFLDGGVDFGVANQKTRCG